MSDWIVLGQVAMRVSRIEAYAVGQDPIAKNTITTIWLCERAEPFEFHGDYGDIVRRAVTGARRG